MRGIVLHCPNHNCKKLLMKEAELNQTEINDYMDDLA